MVWVVFRIGKPLDHVQTILKSLAIQDDFVRFATIFKSAGYGAWLILDSLQWVQHTIDLFIHGFLL